MIKFKVNDIYLKTFSDTKFRVEFESSLFADSIVPSVIIYTFEVPTFENIAIFGYAYERNEINLPARYPAEVLWLDGSWMRGYLVLQRISKFRYSVGFYFWPLPEGFGDEYVANALPSVDFGQHLHEILWAFGSKNQGDTVQWSIDGTVRNFKVDVQAPLLYLDATDDYFLLRNTKNDVGAMLGLNAYTDSAGIFNKKIIASSLYVKSVIEYIFEGYKITGSWINNDFIKKLIILNSKSNNFTENVKKIRIKANWQLYDTTEYYSLYVLKADEIISGDMYRTGQFGEFIYTPGAAGRFVVECFFQKSTPNYIETSGGFDGIEELSTRTTGEKTLNSAPFEMTIVYFLYNNIETLPTNFYVNFYEDTSFLQKPKQTINLGDLLPQNTTKQEFLRNVIIPFGGLSFIDSESKIIEISTADSIVAAPAIDLTAHMVEWYTEPSEPKQRTYSFDAENEYIIPNLSGIYKNLEEPQETEKIAIDTATHAVYKSELVDGEIRYVRQKMEHDVVKIGTAPEKSEIQFSVKIAENCYISDKFELWKTDSEFKKGETCFHNQKLWGSNVDNNASEPGTNSDWEFIANDAIIPVSVNDNTLTITHFKGIKNNERICASSTKFDKNADELTNIDLRMQGLDGIFENFLKKVDFYKNKPVSIFSLDSNIDVEKIRELFRPNTENTSRPRLFRVGDVVYVPKQFSVVLTSFGIEDVQIKGVSV